MRPRPNVTYDAAVVGENGTALVLQGISKRWRGSDAPVLAGIDLTIDAGTAVHIGGPNGSGKTTLLRVAAGIIRPEEGRVRLGSLDVETDRAAFHRQIGFLSAASTGLYARLTVRDHVRLWSRLGFVRRSRRAASCERVVDAFDLRPLERRRVDRLSMGQRQRVRLAGAFVHDPRVVLLDEPGNSLDEHGLELLAVEVHRLCREGGAAVWCSPVAGHRDTPQFDRWLTLSTGRLVES